MSTDPVRYDPAALDRFLGDLPVTAGQPFVAGSWAPALPPTCQTCRRPATRVLALPFPQAVCADHVPGQSPHLCTAGCGQLCEGS